MLWFRFNPRPRAGGDPGPRRSGRQPVNQADGDAALGAQATSGRRRGLPPLAPLRLDAARRASVITRAAAEVWQCRQVSLPPQSGQWSIMASLLRWSLLTSIALGDLAKSAQRPCAASKI